MINLHIEKIIEVARKLGIVNETKIRNRKIIDEFRILRQTETYENATYILADKYNLSEKTIQGIVIGYNKSKLIA